MKRLALALVMLPMLAGLLGGCVVYEDGPRYHHYYWR
jgi:hypothetical protein